MADRDDRRRRPARGAVCGGSTCAAAGPAPGETDLLDPRNLVDRVDAVVLGGGSASGWPPRTASRRACSPTDAAGRWAPRARSCRSCRARSSSTSGAAVCGVTTRGPRRAGGVRRRDRRPRSRRASSARGPARARAGSRAGSGTASVVLPSGVTVAALVAVNAVGSAVDPATGEPWGARHALGDELGTLRPRRRRTSRRPRAGGDARARGAATGDGHDDRGDRDRRDADPGRSARRPAGSGTTGWPRAISPCAHALRRRHAVLPRDGGEAGARPAGALRAHGRRRDVVTRDRPGVLAAESVDASADGGVVLRSYRDASPPRSDRVPDSRFRSRTGSGRRMRQNVSPERSGGGGQGSSGGRGAEPGHEDVVRRGVVTDRDRLAERQSRRGRTRQRAADRAEQGRRRRSSSSSRRPDGHREVPAVGRDLGDVDADAAGAGISPAGWATRPWRHASVGEDGVDPVRATSQAGATCRPAPRRARGPRTACRR